MNPKPYDLRERTFLFAVNLLKLTAMLPENNEARIVKKQIARSGSAIGSNVEEADGSIQGVCEPAEPVRPLSAAEVAQLKTNQKES